MLDFAHATRTLRSPSASNWNAAGLTLMAADTGKLLALRRSNFWQCCKSGGTWCNAGGGRDVKDASPLDTALRETIEEIVNFDPGMLEGEPELAFAYHGWMRPRQHPFLNFIGVVRREFTPQLDLEENDHFQWVKPQEWPEPMHYGMKAFFADPYVQSRLSPSRSWRQSPAAIIAQPRGALIAA